VLLWHVCGSHRCADGGAGGTVEAEVLAWVPRSAGSSVRLAAKHKRSLLVAGLAVQGTQTLSARRL
jgi:hypothetical protein